MSNDGPREDLRDGSSSAKPAYEWQPQNLKVGLILVTRFVPVRCQIPKPSASCMKMFPHDREADLHGDLIRSSFVFHSPDKSTQLDERDSPSGRPRLEVAQHRGLFWQQQSF